MADNEWTLILTLESTDTCLQPLEYKTCIEAGNTPNQQAWVLILVMNQNMRKFEALLLVPLMFWTKQDHTSVAYLEVNAYGTHLQHRIPRLHFPLLEPTQQLFVSPEKYSNIINQQILVEYSTKRNPITVSCNAFSYSATINIDQHSQVSHYLMFYQKFVSLQRPLKDCKRSLNTSSTIFTAISRAYLRILHVIYGICELIK